MRMQSAESAERKSVKIRNADDLPTGEILGQMAEPRPLPMGRKEFEEWSERIISGALVPCKDEDTLKFALCSMLMHLGPHESHKPDAHFIHALRKGAVNEVAAGIMKEIKERKQQEAKDKEESEAKDNVRQIEDAKH